PFRPSCRGWHRTFPFCMCQHEEHVNILPLPTLLLSLRTTASRRSKQDSKPNIAANLLKKLLRSNDKSRQKQNLQETHAYLPALIIVHGIEQGVDKTERLGLGYRSHTGLQGF